MTLRYFLQLIIWFLWLMEPLVAANLPLAMPGCDDTCGNNVTIPYPFGIGRAECFLHEWFEVICHDNRPYLKIISEQEFGGEVRDVSLDYQTIAINANNSKSRVCGDKYIQLARNLSGSPFLYDRYNVVMFVGCGSVMISTTQTDRRQAGTSTSGCKPTSCDQNKRFNGTCDGINCCSFFLPSDSQDFYLNVSNSESTTNSCGSVLFGGGQYSGSSINFSDPSIDILGVPMPIRLDWWIEEWMRPKMDLQNCQPQASGKWSSCRCPICTEGNPYLPNGCQGRSSRRRCMRKSGKNLIVPVVGGTSFGILFIATACFLLYKIIRKKIERKVKQKFFKRNGGLLLQQQLSVDENLVDKVRFFTSRELEKATDFFNKNRVLGHGGQGIVYKGMLVDGKIVAIKKSELANKNQVEQFINEVVVLSQIIHRNVVKLLGCCLETDVPLLVYEFIPNGSLYDLIHNENDEFIMSWEMRLRIATEISGALAYLHTATSVPIYHRDIKSSNILLDEKNRAKVSDFGISKYVVVDQTHVTTMVKGTFGYLDPEYFQSHQFTQKSDIYSFGVVLVELLTRQKAISSARSTGESGLSLATRFLISMREDQLNMILDTQILDVASYKQVKAIATVAQRCLNLDGKKRPTMKEVALELESIKTSGFPSTVQTNFQEPKDTEIELVIFSKSISSLATADEKGASSSDLYPLLSDTF